MIDVRNYILITVSTPDVIPLVTEPKEKQVAVLKNQSGETIFLKSHQLTKELSKFLEQSGLSVEFNKAPDGRRGVSGINGIAVRVTAINHTNYDAGAYIRVPEEDILSLKNSSAVMKYLRQNGIDLDKYCIASNNGTSCVAKLNEDRT